MRGLMLILAVVCFLLFVADTPLTRTYAGEARRPIVKAVAAPVRAAAALAGAIHNREYKPVARAVKAIVGRERRVARRAER